ncbi:MAG TPA: VUT family protein [Candidatus Duodenibacillus intestinavium]|nr:VUT family protein [Candidatus Duodenibacillus intestinavium]
MKRPLSGWLSLVLFVLMIPLTNWVIMNVGLVCPADGPCLIPVWPGLWAPSGVLLAGFSLVLRDVVHHCLGWRWALISIFAGAALSGLISEPALVIASVCAFLFAELADFAVYAPMKKRYPAMAVIVSGLAGSVVDSAIFLSLAFGSIEFLAGQVLGKFWMSLIAGALIVAWRRLTTHTVHEHLQVQ